MLELARKLVNWLSAVVVAASLIWLPIEAYEGLTKGDVEFSYLLYVAAATLIGTIGYLFDGFFFSGALKRSLSFDIAGSNARVVLTTGDLFSETGWRVIAVNDRFDHRVDDVHVSRRSLHGQAIVNYWGVDGENWKDEIAQVRGANAGTRSDIGQAVALNRGADKFIFTVLTATKDTDNTTRANADDLVRAVRGALQAARVVAAGETVVLPMLGGGLGRVRLNPTQLLSIMLSEIVSECSREKVTDCVRIIIPRSQVASLDLQALSRIWSN